MSRPERAWVIGILWCLAACDQLGNPPQFATPPTIWSDAYGRLETTTRSFRNEHTIRRLVSEGLGQLDYADPSIGPTDTLTIVSVVSRRTPSSRGGEAIQLVTAFRFAKRAPVMRRWSAPASSRRWNAAFATPEPPTVAVTSVAP